MTSLTGALGVAIYVKLSVTWFISYSLFKTLFLSQLSSLSALSKIFFNSFRASNTLSCCPLSLYIQTLNLSLSFVKKRLILYLTNFNSFPKSKRKILCLYNTLQFGHCRLYSDIIYHPYSVAIERLK